MYIAAAPIRGWYFLLVDQNAPFTVVFLAKKCAINFVSPGSMEMEVYIPKG